ncbi:hypothetical protein WG922_03745 [Ramlibacter sp. AN1015]|uniref:hypothetical protein n=1 Tax=Ramlibacter sp. AN1015 TaxID=3133428 RepID=UPI0030BAD30B
MKHLIVPALIALAAPLAFAKLPAAAPLDAAGQAKAEEAKAKTAWQAKVDAYQLCQAQDRAAASYRKHASGSQAKPSSNGASGGTPAAAASPAPPSPMPVAASSVTAAAASAPCMDPGPFAFTPPAQKPLESSGAHSPAGTASSPPSVNTPAAQMEPAKK